MANNPRVLLPVIGVTSCVAFLMFAGKWDDTRIVRSVELIEYREFASPEDEAKMASKNLANIAAVMDANSDPLPQRPSNLSAHELCGNNTEKCIQMAQKYESRWLFSQKFKLGTCLIHKSMSTVMQGIMCYLDDVDKYVATGGNINSNLYKKLYCTQKRIRYAANKDVLKNKNNLWKLLVITRDPIDRFLSGFVDKCIRKPTQKNFCNGCGVNMTCFLIRTYKNLQDQQRKRKISTSFEDRHFYPQSWRCDMQQNSKKYKFLRYTSDATKSLLPDLIQSLEDQKVPSENIEFIQNQLLSGRTGHSTIESKPREYLENRLRSSPLLMEYIVRIFYYDFLLLGYELPF